jgi:hypothetical protein
MMKMMHADGKPEEITTLQVVRVARVVRVVRVERHNAAKSTQSASTNFKYLHLELLKINSDLNNVSGK